MAYTYTDISRLTTPNTGGRTSQGASKDALKEERSNSRNFCFHRHHRQGNERNTSTFPSAVKLLSIDRERGEAGKAKQKLHNNGVSCWNSFLFFISFCLFFCQLGVQVKRRRRKSFVQADGQTIGRVNKKKSGQSWRSDPRLATCRSVFSGNSPNF